MPSFHLRILMRYQIKRLLASTTNWFCICFLWFLITPKDCGWQWLVPASYWLCHYFATNRTTSNTNVTFHQWSLSQLLYFCHPSDWIFDLEFFSKKNPYHFRVMWSLAYFFGTECFSDFFPKKKAISDCKVSMIVYAASKESRILHCLPTSPSPGNGPFFAILDLCTFMSEKRGSLLASRGFVVLTVPVFSDKPDNIKELHLDPFEEAVKFLQRQPKVNEIHLQAFLCRVCIFSLCLLGFSLGTLASSCAPKAFSFV